MRKGFTLIELLVATALIMLLTGGTVASFGTYNENQKLSQTAQTLKNNLRLAQGKASSGLKPSGCSAALDGYAVTFTNNSSYAIQARCNDGTLAGDITIVTLPVGVTFSPVPSPSPFVFQVLSRGVNIDVVKDVVLLGRLKKYKIQVSPSGDIKDVGFFI